MINVVARISAKPESTDAIEAAVAAARGTFLADEGCLRYDLQRVAKSEGEYILLEAYDSTEALKRHGEMDAFADFSQAVAPHLLAQPEVIVLSPVGDQVDLAV